MFDRFDRKEEILSLKENPINSSCPQTPQNRLKECSSRRNLSNLKPSQKSKEKKFYSTIGISQSIFNQYSNKSNSSNSLNSRP